VENIFEQAARARKVRAFVRHFDRRIRSTGKHPFVDAAEFAMRLRDSIGVEEWKHHAIQAGQRPPSPDTIAAVISVYEERSESFKEEPIRLQSGAVH
jgi:hypothetical protein